LLLLWTMLGLKPIGDDLIVDPALPKGIGHLELLDIRRAVAQDRRVRTRSRRSRQTRALSSRHAKSASRRTFRDAAIESGRSLR